MTSWTDIVGRPSIRLGTVVTTSPALSVRRDGDDASTPAAPVSVDLVGVLKVGARVLTLLQGRQLIVLGLHHAVGTNTWKSWTPALTATTTNPSMGNTTRVGRYRVADDGTVSFGAIWVIGSTFSAGSGFYNMTLPVNAYVTGGMEWLVKVHVVGTTDIGGEGVGNGKIELTDQITRMYAHRADGTGVRTLSATTGWTTGDKLIVTGTYERAS